MKKENNFEYSHRNFLRQAIEMFGSITALGREIGAHPAHICNWMNRDKTMPGQYASAIQKATEGRIKAKDLCPHIFS